jgi:hypothetical protein
MEKELDEHASEVFEITTQGMDFFAGLFDRSEPLRPPKACRSIVVGSRSPTLERQFALPLERRMSRFFAATASVISARRGGWTHVGGLQAHRERRPLAPLDNPRLSAGEAQLRGDCPLAFHVARRGRR